MTSPRKLAPWLRRFLEDHLVAERRLTRNTQRSYGDSFRLLLQFLSARLRKSPERLEVEDLTAQRVLDFLAHLETERGCSAQTRNQRLAAIRSFARFVASRDPARLAWRSQLRAIATKKAAPQPITWLSKDEAESLLAVPARATLRGRSEHALLLFLYNTGARASEAIGLRVSDLRLALAGGRHGLATLRGKGGKSRQVPLWPRTEQELAELVKGRSEGAVFLSRLGRPYTRFGVYHLVRRCAARVPVLQERRVTPHVLRHTAACQLLRAGTDLNTIRAWLGHVSLDTTNLYAEIDLAAKAKAMELCDAAEPDARRPWKDDKGIMAFLNEL